MKVEVRYMTEFGSSRTIMTLNELTRFIHRHHVIALYKVKKEESWKEESWKDFEIKYNDFINAGGLNGETGEGWINHSKLIPWLKENYKLKNK